MKKWGFQHVKKILPFILIGCILATIGVYFFLSGSNAYTASAVIQYKDERAELGMTPADTPLDVNEIRSSAVMAKVIDRLNLEGDYSVDSLISRLSVTEVPDPDKQAQKEAALDRGEKNDYVPSTYIVSFSASSSEDETFAREVLDEVLDVYFESYSRKYINTSVISNNLYKVYNDNYDYIEMVELIDENLDRTINRLYLKNNDTPGYHSAKTGCSFLDLADEFSYIQKVKVSDLFARIYKNQLTKDKNVLISKYTTRIEDNSIDNNAEEEMIDDILTVIDKYVEKMRDSDNTNITFEYILDEVYNKNLTDGSGEYITGGDQTVTYDELIFAWRDHMEEKEYAVIDSAYARYVIDTFSECTGACENEECKDSPLTCTELHKSNYNTMRNQLEQDIYDVVEELTRLYDLTTLTYEEYNQYQGAQNIAVLSSVSVSETVNVKLYTAIAFLFFVVICSGGAVLIGRVGEIISAAFYTDRITGLSNSAYLDLYLKKMDQKILDDGTVFAYMDILNLRQINQQFNRKTGDEVLKMYAQLLQEVFRKTQAKIIYNGNSRFVILVEKSDYMVVDGILELFRAKLDTREKFENVELRMAMGIEETFRSKITSARQLLAAAMRNKKEYISEKVTRG